VYVYCNLALLGGLTDRDVGYACPGELLVYVFPDLEILA
jgi:hypothetical protein